MLLPNNLSTISNKDWGSVLKNGQLPQEKVRGSRDELGKYGFSPTEDEDVISTEYDYRGYTNIKAGTILVYPEKLSTKKFPHREELFVKRYSFPDTPSDAYIFSIAQSMIRNICYELQKWEENGINFSLGNVASIREEIDKNKQVFIRNNAQSAQFVAALELIFNNNRWEDLDTEVIGRFRMALEALTGKYLTQENLGKFYSTIYELGISLLVE